MVVWDSNDLTLFLQALNSILILHWRKPLAIRTSLPPFRQGLTTQSNAIHQQRRQILRVTIYQQVFFRVWLNIKKSRFFHWVTFLISKNNLHLNMLQVMSKVNLVYLQKVIEAYPRFRIPVQSLKLNRSNLLSRNFPRKGFRLSPLKEGTCSDPHQVLKWCKSLNDFVLQNCYNISMFKGSVSF